MSGVGDDGYGAAVRQEVGDLGLGRVRVERYGNRAGPGDRQIAFDVLDAVPQQDRDPVAPVHTHVHQVPGDPSGPRGQFGMRQCEPRVHVRYFVAEPFSIRAKQIINRPYQFRA
nr:hypothetical protein [Streptomyces rapamycinicus]